MEKAAKALNLTPAYLLTLYKKETGRSFADDLIKKRVANAKTLLEKTERKILDIALTSGFENLSTFDKNFKKVFGVTPSEVRRGPT